MDDNNSVFEVDFKKIAAGSRMFVHARIRVGGDVIGDMEQAVLLGSFRLALLDAVQRLSAGRCIAFTGDVDFRIAFDALYDAAWKGETKALCSLLGRSCTTDEAMCCIAIPTGIETFHGEQGFSFVIGTNECFCWRDWESKCVRMIYLQRSNIVSVFSAALGELGAM